MSSPAPLPTLIEALRPYREDFLHYCPRALRIRTKKGAIVPFNLNRAQLYVYNQVMRQWRETGKVRARVLKARQEGISTFVQGWFYWLVTGSFGKQAFILTHEQQATDNLFDMTMRFHTLVPELLRPVTGAASAKELHFSALDSGYRVATAGTKNVGRSRTIQYFHGSEVAFWPWATEHLAGIGQAVPNERDTVVILESTADGVGNVFHQGWTESSRGDSEYINLFVPWQWMDEYQAAAPAGFTVTGEDAEYQRLYALTDDQMYWRFLKIRDDFSGDSTWFDQEYPASAELAFRKTSGQVLIPAMMVERARRDRGAEARGPRIMGVDPAEYGDDDTCMALRQGRVQHEFKRYHGRGPMEVAALAANRAEEWKADLICVDATGLGSGIADRLAEITSVPVMRVLFGERAIEDEHYAIRRDELWGDLKKWLEDVPCRVVDDDSLQSDLCGPQYTHDSSRRMKLESKESMRKRKVKSPDGGDALALTFAAKGAPPAGRIDHRRVRSSML